VAGAARDFPPAGTLYWRADNGIRGSCYVHGREKLSSGSRPYGERAAAWSL